MALVSVIVPVFNVEIYLVECIESIRRQTLSDLEIILVDDGSNDSSGTICDHYKVIDRRIKVLHKKNSGLSDARNAGIDASTGEFIGFVDSDDYIDPDMYLNLYSACKNYGAEVAVCARNDLRNNTTNVQYTFDRIQVWDSETSIRRLLAWNGIDSSVCDKLFMRHIFRTMRFPSEKYNEDVFVMVKVLGNAERIVHTGIPMYYYRYRSDSISNQAFSRKKMDLLEASDEVVDYIRSNYPHLQETARAYSLRNTTFLLGLIIRSKNREAYLEEHHRLKKRLRIDAFWAITSNETSILLKFIVITLLTRVYGIIFNIYGFINQLYLKRKKLAKKGTSPRFIDNSDGQS